ncbi:hypothetical protein CERSUDRAFT_110747 [Gelatoporia subvermispora B]|uniref:Glycine cleavage system H protein n=1 Tax=Ceriporiopsis subvermispora (strain B) TaxID=914234 RepID=M2RTE6_CERS8|nr:hypothetical protein CERSUDRAFT_110747 [Gelatoporia subvermispora B]
MFSALRTASRSGAFAVRAAQRQAGARLLPRATPFVRTLITKGYSKEHEALIFDDSTNVGTVCISNHAQEKLGDVVYVELSSPGTKVEQGESIGALESVKATSEIYSPVSGTIEEVNEALSDRPGLINQSSEKDGWVCKIKVDNPADVKALMNEEAYEKFCTEESDD